MPTTCGTLDGYMSGVGAGRGVIEVMVSLMAAAKHEKLNALWQADDNADMSFEMLSLPPSFYLRQNVSVTQAPCTFLSAPTKKHISVCLLSSILFSCLPLLYLCKVVSKLFSCARHCQHSRAGYFVPLCVASRGHGRRYKRVIRMQTMQRYILYLVWNLIWHFRGCIHNYFWYSWIDPTSL